MIIREGREVFSFQLLKRHHSQDENIKWMVFLSCSIKQLSEMLRKTQVKRLLPESFFNKVARKPKKVNFLKQFWRVSNNGTREILSMVFSSIFATVFLKFARVFCLVEQTSKWINYWSSNLSDICPGKAM